MLVLYVHLLVTLQVCGPWIVLGGRKLDPVFQRCDLPAGVY